MLEEIDDDLLLGEDRHEMKRQQKAFAEMEREWQMGIIDAETDDDRISEISRRIAEEYVRLEKMLRIGTPYEIIRSYLPWINEMSKCRVGIRARQLHTMGEIRDDGKVSDQDVERARLYPLERLIENLPKDGRIPCPFHEGEGRNFLVKNSYGYCFTCAVSVDAIKWLMDIDRMNFTDAVRRLNGRL